MKLRPSRMLKILREGHLPTTFKAIFPIKRRLDPVHHQIEALPAAAKTPARSAYA